MSTLDSAWWNDTPSVKTLNKIIEQHLVLTPTSKYNHEYYEALKRCLNGYYIYKSTPVIQRRYDQGTKYYLSLLTDNLTQAQLISLVKTHEFTKHVQLSYYAKLFAKANIFAKTSAHILNQKTSLKITNQTTFTVISVDFLMHIDIKEQTITFVTHDNLSLPLDNRLLYLSQLCFKTLCFAAFDPNDD